MTRLYAPQSKSDSSGFAAKLAIRRHMLDTYHADGSAEVLDCCQGDGEIWRKLRQTHAIKSYWGVDVKKRKGRLKVDSSRILAVAGWTQDFIDIDTYGRPWAHWLALLPNVTRPITVCLTIGLGTTQGNMAKLPKAEASAMGIPERFNLSALGADLHKLGIDYMLAAPIHFSVSIDDIVEATYDRPGVVVNRNTVQRGRWTRYVGVRLSPEGYGNGRINGDRVD